MVFLGWLGCWGFFLFIFFSPCMFVGFTVEVYLHANNFVYRYGPVTRLALLKELNFMVIFSPKVT